MSRTKIQHDAAIRPGRELALLLLCHLDKLSLSDHEAALELLRTTGTSNYDGAAGLLAPFLSDPQESAFAFALVTWLDVNRPEIDAIIDRTSERWRLSRMEVTDRNALRLATAELMRAQQPKQEIIADIVRLATRYGSERSGRFVHGLTEAVARALTESQ